jgi:hypothetical protein
VDTINTTIPIVLWIVIPPKILKGTDTPMRL